MRHTVQKTVFFRINVYVAALLMVACGGNGIQLRADMPHPMVQASLVGTNAVFDASNTEYFGESPSLYEYQWRFFVKDPSVECTPALAYENELFVIPTPMVLSCGTDYQLSLSGDILNLQVKLLDVNALGNAKTIEACLKIRDAQGNISSEPSLMGDCQSITLQAI